MKQEDGTRRYTTEVVANNVQFLECDKSNQQGYQQSNIPDGFMEVDNSEDDIPFKVRGFNE